jgi:hypothetical protein
MENAKNMFGNAFGDFVDHALTDNFLNLLIFLVVPGAHIAALIAAFTSREGTRALSALNIVVSGTILFYIVSQPVYFEHVIEGSRPTIWVPALFELVALVAGVAALWRIRLAVGLSCAIFGAHSLLSGIGVAFMLLFNYTR